MRRALVCMFRSLAVVPAVISLLGCSDGDDAATPTPSATQTSTASATPTLAPPTSTVTASAPPSATAPPTPTATADLRLGTLARAAGVFVGAGFVEGSHDPRFRELLVSEFNSATAPIYWSQIQPQPGVFDFTAPDAAVEIGEANGLRLRGHPLIWGRLALPDSVQQASDADSLRAMITERIETVLGRYRGRIVQYDVVNEPLTVLGGPGVTGTGLEDYVFLRLLGPGYIREALELAHAADPDAELYINEFFVERPGPKQDAFFELVRGLVESGAPLHGVGFQGHIMLPFFEYYLPTRDEVAAAVQRFTALGLDVEITELDVPVADPATQLETQARIYADMFAGCFETPGCRGITTWGISDRYTWIRDSFQREGAPLLFDFEFMPKPAYFAVREVLRGLSKPPMNTDEHR